jgi:hypothetical protein
MPTCQQQPGGGPLLYLYGQEACHESCQNILSGVDQKLDEIYCHSIAHGKKAWLGTLHPVHPIE